MAKKHLKTSENCFHSIVDNTADAIITIDSSGKMVYVNSSTCAEFGYIEADLLGKNVVMLMPKRDRAEHKQSMGRFLKTHKPHIIGKTVELVGVKSDGTEFPIELSLSVTNDEQGILFAGVIRDITDRKKTAQNLVENQRKLEQAQKITGIGLVDWHIKTNEIELSDDAVNILGVEPKTKFMAPDSLIETVYPPDREYVHESLELAIREEKQYDIDHRVLKPDGTILWVHSQAELIRDSAGKPETLLGTMIDINDRRQHAEKVKAERDKAQQYLDITGTMLVQIGRDKKVKMINKKGCQILGYDESEIIGKNWFNLVIPTKQRAEAKTVFNQIMGGQIKAVEHFENQVETKSHDIRFMTWKSILVHDSKGNATACLSSGEDITNHKEIEAKLLEGEKRYRTLVDSSAECICQLDTKGNFLYMNPTGLEGHEITSIDDLQKLCCFDLAEPAYHKVLKDTLKAARTGEIQRFEYESETVDGIRWFESIMAPITDESSKIQSFIRLSTDITDRKQSDLVRRENEERLRRTLQGAVKALSTTTALRDPYTVSHQERVSKLACAIGEELGFSEDRLEGLHTAAELHDVGKVHVPAEILTKPGVITEHEFKIIQYHVQAGFDILEDIDFPWSVADFVLQHHERLNGSGYPNGLKEEDILEEAKIIAVADVVEAMSSRRPYRAGLGIGPALQEISRNKGVLYDPKIVRVCLRLFRKKGFEFRSESREKAA